MNEVVAAMDRAKLDEGEQAIVCAFIESLVRTRRNPGGWAIDRLLDMLQTAAPLPVSDATLALAVACDPVKGGSVHTLNNLIHRARKLGHVIHRQSNFGYRMEKKNA